MGESAAAFHWLEPDWLAGAIAWIRERLAESGNSIIGAIEQPHVRSWSTVLRVPTSEGDVYFKAVSPIHQFEPGLASLLSRLQPDRVPELLAVDTDRGWMLMRDGGIRLRELINSADDLHHWEALLPRYAELQIRLAEQAEKLLALGVPDERLAGIPAQLQRLLEDPQALLFGRTEGLTADERAQLRAGVPEVALMCRELASYGIPETLQHDDFHDGNVFVRDGRCMFFDWGDSCVSHPFHTLVVTLRSIAYTLDLEPGGAALQRLRQAYLEPFARCGSSSELLAAADLAYRTGTLARALAWHRFLSAREPQFREEDADSVPYGLKRFLAGGPIGTWR